MRDFPGGAPTPPTDQPADRSLPSAYNVLRPAVSGALVLTSDFSAGTGRTVGSFGDLVPKLHIDHPVWETAPPPIGAEAGMSATDHLDRWILDVQASGREVHAVFGYCVGSVFAAGLVERIVQWQRELPLVVVFDPERPHAALLHRHYQDAIEVMSRTLSAAELADAEQAGKQALTDATSLTDLANTLSGLVIQIGDPAFARAGLDAARRGELLGTFRSFLLYLVAASDLDPTPVWAQAVAISSASPDNGLNTLPVQQRAGMVAREIRFDLPHADLLRNAEVAAAVQELLD